LSHFFLSEAKVVDEHTIGLGFFDGTKIGALDVLDKSKFEKVLIGDLVDQSGDLLEACALSGSPAPFSRYDFKMIVDGADYDRLEKAFLSYRSGQFSQFLFREAYSRLKRVRYDSTDVDQKDGSITRRFR